MEANRNVAETMHVPHFNLICRVCFASSAFIHVCVLRVGVRVGVCVGCVCACVRVCEGVCVSGCV